MAGDRGRDRSWRRRCGYRWRIGRFVVIEFVVELVERGVGLGCRGRCDERADDEHRCHRDIGNHGNRRYDRRHGWLRCDRIVLGLRDIWVVTDIGIHLVERRGGLGGGRQ